MSLVKLDMTMSLDGYSTGEGGDLSRVQAWLIGENGPTGSSAEVVGEFFASTGAWVMGRRTFDTGEEPWGAEPPFAKPCFVVTHETRDRLVKGATSFDFVPGVELAVAQAKEAADGRDVTVIGGADIAQQCLSAGILDQIDIHLAPLLLGAGTRLFDRLNIKPTDLGIVRVTDSPDVTHLRFTVNR
ncbi:dihydrofolate reductase family protein [Catellatospora methionotrophica]|uniref:dihydrofolate reductase family protein n=1 Tax=Catellatospora methionotrophica TaxID=121620 RepID=UPI0034078C38